MSALAHTSFPLDDSTFDNLFADEDGSSLLFDLTFVDPTNVDRCSAAETGPAKRQAATATIRQPARKPSPTESADPDKNARMAKANRDRHKQYVAGLEKTVESLTKDNSKLQAEKARSESRMAEALAEIERLRTALSGQSAIAQALKQIGHGMSLCFEAGAKRSNDNEDDEMLHSSKKTSHNNSHNNSNNNSNNSNSNNNNSTTTVVLPFHINISLPSTSPSSLSM